MKNLIVLICLLLSFQSFSHDNKEKGKHKGHNKHHHEDSAFEVIPLNSPVKEANAKFKLVVPASTEISKVFYKIKNSSKIHELNKDLNKRDETSLLANNEISIPVSKLPPGQYRLHVWIKTKKGEEYHCSRKKQDFAKFVVDDSLQVPAPDPTKDAATLAGIDSDNDGIADRVQRWINERFGSRPSFKEALKQYARAEQNTLLNADDRQATIQNINKAAESQSCLSWINGNENVENRRNVDNLMQNTELRVKAGLKASSQYHGQDAPDSIVLRPLEQRYELCDFEAIQETAN